MDQADLISQARGLLGSADRITALTGSGVSAESGVPTFRGAGGLWEDVPVEEVATPQGFAADPDRVWQFYCERRVQFAAVKPNAAHVALAELQRRVLADGRAFTLITQNIDSLHAEAGSTGVIEVHGTAMFDRCSDCVYRQPVLTDPPDSPPICPECGGLLRPDVIWFGEQLPPAAVTAALEACHTCDLFLSIGTSALVQPVASFIRLAMQHGAKTIEINADPTPISGLVDVSVLGKAGDLLPLLVDGE